jgi:hypothetical protein
MKKEPGKLVSPDSYQSEGYPFAFPEIHTVRGQKIMLDCDVAQLYGVTTSVLRRQATKNAKRFPKDFRFQLTGTEADRLASRQAIPSRQSLGSALPYGYTEEGVAMLSYVIRSPRAVQVSLAIIRVFG